MQLNTTMGRRSQLGSDHLAQTEPPRQHHRAVVVHGQVTAAACKQQVEVEVIAVLVSSLLIDQQ
jgi:hypothetical protein